MKEYKVGDRFIVTLTSINDTGMGSLYTLSSYIQTDKFVMEHLDRLEPCENVAISPTETFSEPQPRKYTLDELQERILVISDLLNQTVNAYREAKSNLKNGIEIADNELARYRL